MTIPQYDKLCDVIAPLLLSTGFAIQTEQESPQAFGSAHIIFQKQNAAFQFVWDGKEGWFRLSYCPDISHLRPAWDDIVIEYFDPRQHSEERTNCITRILESRMLDFIQHL